MLILVVIALAAVFSTQRLAPGGPFDGEKPPPPEILANLRAYYDMDLGMPSQFMGYLFGMAARDVGQSGRPGRVHWLTIPDRAKVSITGSIYDELTDDDLLVRKWCPWDEWLSRWVSSKPDQRPLRKCGVLRGDFGLSMTKRNIYVNDYVRDGLPGTLKYAVPSLLFALFLGVPMGFLAAYFQNTRVDFAMVSAGMVGTIIPNLVMGPILIYLLAIQLDGFFHWLFVDYLDWVELSRRQRTLNLIPSGKSGGPIHYFLPTLVLGTALLGRIVRLSRAGALEALRSNYVRTARSKGLPNWLILFRHVLKPGILPVVTYLGPVSAVILTGSLVIEYTFSLPGLGSQFISAATDRDYTLLMGTTVILLVFVIVLNFIVDLLYTWLDPRIRTEGSPT